MLRNNLHDTDRLIYHVVAAVCTAFSIRHFFFIVALSKAHEAQAQDVSNEERNNTSRISISRAGSRQEKSKSASSVA